MAKLSARGRTCQAEVVREYTLDELQSAHDRYQASYTPDYVAGADPSLCVWERKTKRLMSDGTVLVKLDVRFRPSQYDHDPRGRKHSYGWKVEGTLKAGKTVADWTRTHLAPRKDGNASPWTLTQGYVAPPVLLSQARILRAIQSGESIGFCTSCGHDQDGVEPDAEGYTCESCGADDVTGAENLLLSL